MKASGDDDVRAFVARALRVEMLRKGFAQGHDAGHIDIVRLSVIQGVGGGCDDALVNRSPRLVYRSGGQGGEQGGVGLMPRQYVGFDL